MRHLLPGCIHHSGRGVQDAARDYVKELLAKDCSPLFAIGLPVSLKLW